MVTTSSPGYTWDNTPVLVKFLPFYLQHPYLVFNWNNTQGYYMCSWHLPMFLNLKEAMSHILETHSQYHKSSHKDREYHSESVTELEEGSTTLEEDTFLSIWYPSPPNFPTPHVHNWDFGDPDKALNDITRNFNFKSVSKSLRSFINLAYDLIYYNRFVDDSQFTHQ